MIKFIVINFATTLVTHVYCLDLTITKQVHWLSD